MSAVNNIFQRLLMLTGEEGQQEFISAVVKYPINNESTPGNVANSVDQKTFLQKIIIEIDKLATEIKDNNTILISVKNQKLLRTCFQLITSLGFSSCLIPGLGISLSKRCSYAIVLPPTSMTDEQKYEMLTTCVDFFTRCYEIPVLKNIIITFHLSDYLAALIQLSFAPLKKPGTYKDFIMTQEMYDKINLERNSYIQVYEHLVANCFQPTLMKELLVLQSVTDPCPPAFAKRVIGREMSRRLLAPGGLLSLIRCFIDSYEIDTGSEWRKIDMICKIVGTKHGNRSEEIYLNNMCAQLVQILVSNNIHYLTTAVSCVLSLYEKYPQNNQVKCLIKDIFQSFDYDSLVTNSNLPGTVILSPQEVEHKLNILHAAVCTCKLECPKQLILPNLYVLFILGAEYTKNDEIYIKLKNTLLKSLEFLDKNEIYTFLYSFLFGKRNVKSTTIAIEEFDAGLAIKCAVSNHEYPQNKAVIYFIRLFKASTGTQFVQDVFEACLKTLIRLSEKRKTKAGKNILLTVEDEPVLLDENDKHYASILQLLSEISTSPKVMLALKTNPSIVLDFIEHFISRNETTLDEECVAIALVLLNTILRNSKNTIDLRKRIHNLTPVLKKMSKNESDLNYILCQEALSLISSEEPLHQEETKFGKAICDVYDDLLPVRAHGIIELTKLIDAKDPETISKKHYIFCLFQEQLKDTDSYIYLSAINGIAALASLCTDDVLQVLCQEFLQLSLSKSVETKEDQNKMIELRMKIGDVIVKVTRRLGEMAIVHKTLLLNTTLCGCRDEDPLIRASALSNLAEIALVLHYKIGSIIYEVLLCIWTIIETDIAIECRRAAVMVISSLLKGLGQETLVQLKENLLPIYRTLKKLYNDPDEDSVVRLHTQIALETLNETVNQFLFPELNMEKQIYVLDKPADMFK